MESVRYILNINILISSAHPWYLLRPYVNYKSPQYNPFEQTCQATHPKYLNGHILKCFTSIISSFSASVLSFLGLPLPLAGGAFDLGLVVGVE